MKVETRTDFHDSGRPDSDYEGKKYTTTKKRITKTKKEKKRKKTKTKAIKKKMSKKHLPALNHSIFKENYPALFFICS